MHPVEALERLGGTSDTATLLQLTTRGALQRSLRGGEVLRVARGRYALTTAAEGLKAAARLTGTASHLSAASHHGWELATRPERPAVIVPRTRKVPPERRHGVDLRWRDLLPREVHDRVTEHHRTVLDCARDLDFVEALAVADSALRHRDVDKERLLDLAAALPTNGRNQAIRVATEASPLAANPFESALRAIALDVPGLDLRPQVWIEERGFRGRPDLVDRRRRLVVEADSFAFHGTRKALRRDCERYNALVVRGWTVLRFAWEHVMFERDYVRDCLMAVAEGSSRHAALPPTLLWTA